MTLSLLILLGGCAAVPVNAPLPATALNDSKGPISKAGYRLTGLPHKDKASDLMVLLARTSAGLAASYTLVNPIIAMLLGVTLGNETVTAPEWLAAGVILAGVVLLLIRPAR